MYSLVKGVESTQFAHIPISLKVKRALNVKIKDELKLHYPYTCTIAMHMPLLGNCEHMEQLCMGFTYSILCIHKHAQLNTSPKRI